MTRGALVATVCACKNKHPLADPTAGGLLCGAQTKQAGAKYPTCHRPAGWGTPDGVASGHRCKLHGGVTTTLKSGRYSTMKSSRIRDLIAEHEQDADPLNILPELAAARALFVSFLERYEEFTDALLAWHESYEASRVPLPEDKVMAFESVINEWEIALREGKTEPTERQLAEVAAARKFMDTLRGKTITGKLVKPRQVLDVSDAYRIVSEITKIVERIEKIRAENAISRKDLIRVMDAMGRGLMKHIEDPAILKAIRAEWLAIAV